MNNIEVLVDTYALTQHILQANISMPQVHARCFYLESLSRCFWKQTYCIHLRKIGNSKQSCKPKP